MKNAHIQILRVVAVLGLIFVLNSCGSTQVLPETGNMLSNFSVLTEVPDSTVKSAKIIETSGSDLPEVVSTIAVSNSTSDWGVRVYRAWKLPVDYRIL